VVVTCAVEPLQVPGATAREQRVRLDLACGALTGGLTVREPHDAPLDDRGGQRSYQLDVCRTHGDASRALWAAEVIGIWRARSHLRERQLIGAALHELECHGEHRHLLDCQRHIGQLVTGRVDDVRGFAPERAGCNRVDGDA
jgi:hypothetical protein